MDDRAWIREDTLTMQLAIPPDLRIYNRTYTVEQGTYNEQLLMKSWLKYDKIMLAGSIPRAKRRKKLIIGVITTCGSTCTLIHMMSHGIC